MMCYRDMTFCTHYETCELGATCPRALTQQVKDDAELWMKNPPICIYTDNPWCYKERA